MKRMLSNINSIAAVLLAFVLAQMIGFVALRNPLRANVSGRTYYELSDKTLSLLEGLENEVKVTVFFQKEHDLYEDIDNLLEEYQYHSRNISVEWVDPARDLARVEKYASEYGLTEAQVIVFDIEGHNKIIKQNELAEYVQEQNRKQPTRSAFKGEQVFSSAIYGLIQGERPVVRFLVGHGEHRVSDFDQSGFSNIGVAVLNDNLDVKELMLSGENQIPEDTAALVIAGPDKKMSTVEIEMIEDYLSRGGRVLMLLDALKETGLEPMLRRWGVALRDDIVVDPENTLRGSDVHVRRFNAHPISMEMETSAQFILPRSVMALAEEEGASAEDRPSIAPLFFTSERSWSETQVEESPAKFDAGTADLRGDDPERPLSLGVAVELGARREALDVQIKPSRMVVFGDSDFASNIGMVGGNQDLFMSALNWLLDREELMAIAPKPVEEVRLSLSRKDIRRFFWINVTGVPLIAMVIGLFVWARRRK